MSRKGSSMVPNNWANQGSFTSGGTTRLVSSYVRGLPKNASWVNGFAMWEWAPVLPFQKYCGKRYQLRNLQQTGTGGY